MRRILLPALVALTVAGIVACGDETKKKPGNFDGFILPDSGVTVDGRSQDLGALPDIEVNAEGPKIEIGKPADGTTVIGETISVEATITDADGVDDQTVEANLSGKEPVRMSITSTPGVYRALLDISSYTDKIRLFVKAADLAGNANTAVRDFARDPGPVVQILSPGADSRHKGSVSLQIAVADRVAITKFDARIGSVTLQLRKTNLAQNKDLYNGTVKFDDPIFVPPLSGDQVITVTAENENGARTIVDRKFVVDNEGPEIVISSQAPGELIGAIIALEATVTDEAGVVPSTVKCVIGNNLTTRTIALKADPGAPTVYKGQFDTRTLSQFDLWPVMSFRAADTLGNENHADIQVGLDNGPPELSLDPPDTHYQTKEVDNTWQCSHPFDPVGSDAANDLELVPQVIYFRARIEDLGNHVPSAPWVPISTVDKVSARMFFLDDTSQAVVVDTTGDGYCDSINPEVVPLGSQPAAGQAVAVGLVPIAPTGTADFTPYTTTGASFPTTFVSKGGQSFLFSCLDGEAEQPPDPICDTTSMIIAQHYTDDTTEPAIYAIPPVGTALGCAGLPFDFLANSFEDGWTCVAVVARDLLGNQSVSPPLRVWVDKSAAGRSKNLPVEAGTPPNCTGTLNATTGKVDGSKACTFRTVNQVFPQVYPTPSLQFLD